MSLETMKKLREEILLMKQLSDSPGWKLLASHLERDAKSAAMAFQHTEGSALVAITTFSVAMNFVNSPQKLILKLEAELSALQRNMEADR